MKKTLFLFSILVANLTFGQYNITYDTLYFGGTETNTYGTVIDDNNNSYCLVRDYYSPYEAHIIKRDLNGLFVWKTVFPNPLSKTYRIAGGNNNDHLFYRSLTGFSNSAKDYDIKIENHKTGAGVRITSDQPISKIVFWSAPKTVCPVYEVLYVQEAQVVRL